MIVGEAPKKRAVIVRTAVYERLHGIGGPGAVDVLHGVRQICMTGAGSTSLFCRCSQAIGAIICVWLGVVTGCGNGPTSVVVPNQPPEVRITAGPMQDSLHVHRVTFHWSARDPDGRVAGFEYAIDDTTQVDSVRSTQLRQTTLALSADQFLDTVVEIIHGEPVEVVRFARHHVFHVRAIDNQELASAWSSAAFYAFTIAPSTTITLPDPRYPAEVGRTFDVAWFGEDLDGSRPPDAFSHRLIPVPVDSLWDVARLDRPGGGPQWSPFERATGVRFEQVVPGTYLLGVRALDEAGAEEPLLRIGANVARISVSDEPGVPVVSIQSGDREYILEGPYANPDEAILVTSGEATSVAWTADASHYAATIVEFAFGVDLESIDPTDPDWIPVTEARATLRLDNPPGVEETDHLLHLRLRDSIGRWFVYGCLLRVGPPDHAFEILYVDDVGGDHGSSTGHPSDVERDAFIAEVLLAECQRRGYRVDQVELQDPRGFPVDEFLDIEVFRRYQLLVWSVSGSGAGLTRAALDPDRPLATYLSGGGNLFLFGTSVLTRSMPQVPTQENFGFNPGEFGYEFLHIESVYEGGQVAQGGFSLARGTPGAQRVDGLDGATPTAAAQLVDWPTLLVAKPPFTSNLYGIPNCEGMVVGYEHAPRPGRLDTLYTYVTNGSRLWPPSPSRFDDAPCAFRYRGAGQGKVMVFAFPMYFWSDGAADSLGTRAVEWFFDID
jgi:hypothetical protein